MIRAVIFDIGGVLEVVPEGGDPTRRFPRLLARWEERLQLAPGELDARLTAMDEQLVAAGKDGALGTCTEAEWRSALQDATSMNDALTDIFMRDFWDVYLGEPNPELAAYFGALRPRYQTALLSNSFVGARREEEARYSFSTLADLIIYSHEEGVAKPNPRIYALTCERLAVEPEEALFLDDAEPNVVAARACGIDAIHFRQNNQAIAAIEARLNTARG